MSSPKWSVDLFFHVRADLRPAQPLGRFCGPLSSGRIRLPLPEQIDLNSSFRRARVGADGGAEIVYISNESLLVILVVGLVAGWLAGKIVRGSGFGL